MTTSFSAGDANRGRRATFFSRKDSVSSKCRRMKQNALKDRQ